MINLYVLFLCLYPRVIASEKIENLNCNRILMLFYYIKYSSKYLYLFRLSSKFDNNMFYRKFGKLKRNQYSYNTY